MKKNIKKRLYSLLLAPYFFSPFNAHAFSLLAQIPPNLSLYDQYPWAALYYYGITATDTFSDIMFHQQFHRWPEHIQSIELTHTLSTCNGLRRLVYPLVGVVEVAANVTVRNDNGKIIYEFIPYIEGRWSEFPWNKYLMTSFAIGEGVSYTTSIPSLEIGSSEHAKRLLNYMLMEATLSVPKYPRWQLVIRLHHRSGAYGLYHAGNSGSNNMGLGIRYLFD